jgi:glutamate 5-kinase
MKLERRFREFLPESRRVVVKIGTRVIAQPSGRPDTRRLRALVSQVAGLRRKGYEMLVVTSGAVGAGMEALGIRSRPTAVPDLQMCAAVGQARLMARYEAFFAAEKLKVGQVLLTHGDFLHRVRFANARRTMEHLLRAGVVPIINENDVVADEELKADLSLGDNDYLAALVAQHFHADLLVILSTVAGLLEPTSQGSMRRVSHVDYVGADIFRLVNPGKSALSKGGMDSKLRAAQMVSRAGCAVVVANGRQNDVLSSVLSGLDIGTCIAPYRFLPRVASSSASGTRRGHRVFRPMTVRNYIDATEWRGRKTRRLVRVLDGAAKESAP